MMELSELVGPHTLDAVDLSDEQFKSLYGKHFEDCAVCRFRLDGIVYSAVEDPDDGYRSCMRELLVDENTKPKNVFPPVSVICKYLKRRTNRLGITDDCEILEIVRADTGQAILAVGTDYALDYYPCYVANFNPKALGLVEESR